MYTKQVPTPSKISMVSNEHTLIVKNHLLYMLIQLVLATNESVFNMITSVFDFNFILSLLHQTEDSSELFATLALRLLLAEFKRSNAVLTKVLLNRGFDELSLILVPYAGCNAVYHSLFQLLFINTLSDTCLMLINGIKEDSSSYPSEVALKYCSEVYEFSELQSRFDSLLMNQWLPDDILSHCSYEMSDKSSQIMPEITKIILNLLCTSLRENLRMPGVFEVEALNMTSESLDLTDDREIKRRVRSATVSQAEKAASLVSKSHNNQECRYFVNSSLPKCTSKIDSLILKYLQILFKNSHEFRKLFWSSSTASLVNQLFVNASELSCSCPLNSSYSILQSLICRRECDKTLNTSVISEMPKITKEKSAFESIFTFFANDKVSSSSSDEIGLSFPIASFTLEELDKQLFDSFLSVGNEIDSEYFSKSPTISSLPEWFACDTVLPFFDFVQSTFIYNLFSNPKGSSLIEISISSLFNINTPNINRKPYSLFCSRLFLSVSMQFLKTLDEESLSNNQRLLPNIVQFFEILIQQFNCGYLCRGALLLLHIVRKVAIQLSLISVRKYGEAALKLVSLSNRFLVIIYSKLDTLALSISPEIALKAICELHWVNRYVIIHHMSVLDANTNVGPFLAYPLTYFCCRQLLDYVVPIPSGSLSPSLETRSQNSNDIFSTLSAKKILEDLRKSATALLSCIMKLKFGEIVDWLTVRIDNSTEFDAFTSGFDRLLVHDSDCGEFLNWINSEKTFNFIHYIMKHKWLPYMESNEYSFKESVFTRIASTSINLIADGTDKFSPVTLNSSKQSKRAPQAQNLDFQVAHMKHKFRLIVTSFISVVVQARVEQVYFAKTHWDSLILDLKYQRSLFLANKNISTEFSEKINSPVLSPKRINYEYNSLRRMSSLVGPDLPARVPSTNAFDIKTNATSFVNKSLFDIDNLYQRWRVDFIEGIGRTRLRLESFCFEPAQISSWVLTHFLL